VHVWFPGRRAAAHALALGAVTSLVVTGVLLAAPRREPPVIIEPVVEESPLPAWLEPAQRPLVVAPTPIAGARTQGADQTTATTAAAFNPRLGLPRWLRTIRDTRLWSGSGAAAPALDSLPANTAFYLKPLGTFSDGRLDVYFPGDGDSRPPAQAWVDATAVEPSGIPPWVATPLAQSSANRVAPPRKTGDQAAPNTSAWYMAIVDDASGQLLYGEKPHETVPQASTTKIATTIVALERAGDLSRRIKVTVSATAMAARDGSSTLGIEPGRSVSLDTLLYGMMLPSGNDAAEQIALSLADSREEFVGWMNDEAAALGLADTHFVNPSGMDAAGHYSSAYDMAMLARYAMRNPTFRALASTTSHTGDGYPMHNLNRLLDFYSGADGVKIGYTDLAQKTIVASAMRDGHRVYVSLMHSSDLVTDSIRMFDWVWNNYEWGDKPAEPAPSDEPGQLAE
jgi:D-alanyl-D-alanine carboxypeptidase